MELKFKAGDMVKLYGDMRIAPQIMTVSHAHNDGTVLCVWFNHKNEIQEHRFAQSILYLAFPDTTKPSLLTE